MLENMGDILTNFNAFITHVKPVYEIWNSVMNVRKTYVEVKTKRFIEDVYNKVKDIKIQDVHKNDILHNFYITLDAIQKVRKLEQLERFSEIFKTYLQSDELQHQEYDDSVHNKYELVLNMINELSYLELELLVMLYRYEKPYRDKNVKVKSVEYWDEQFIKEAQTKFQLKPQIIITLFQKMHAKGMFYINGSVGFGDSDIKVGTLTDLFVMIVSYMPTVK